ncbi:MAG: efflux RND transporter periplasmic adaptor subunit [Pirellulales bacterium]|nr:efflux RND transporter periplasmic adaptor subunit [Pirellulales bacterium]
MTIRTLATLALGLALGAATTWYWAANRAPTSGGVHLSPAMNSNGSEKPQVWTCSMHPQIRMDHFDICPLCGMDLTPVVEDAGGDQPATQLRLSEQARRMARVATAEVKRQRLFKELRTVGRVELDETRTAKIAAWIDGRVDKVYADFPGTPVRKGEHLVSIYSPELVSAQEEYLTAYRREQELRQNSRLASAVSLSASARKRLQLWGITDAQLDELVRTGKSQTQMTVYAPIGGTVIEKYVRDGQYVKQGDPLYDIADLGHVWLIIEVYESELAWVKPGQPVEVRIESQPNRPLPGVVGFIEPLLNKASRTVQVRVVMENPGQTLKPGMYAEALLRTPILPDGTPASSGLEGKYVCPMHPYVVSDKPGDCGVCNMPLERVPGEPNGTAEQPGVLAVPADAVLTTGRRQLVYVEKEPGVYQLVEPKLGPRAGDWYPVLGSLEEGDRVVVRGNFLLDSQFQVTGKPSLLYPHGSTGGTGHEGHGEPRAKPKEPDAKILANLDKLPPEDREAAKAQRTCPITDGLLGSMGKPYKMMIGNQALFLCCKGCEGKVRKDPDAVLKKLRNE